MDFFLDSVTKQAMNYAIRSGIGITATYAIQQSARLLKVQQLASPMFQFLTHSLRRLKAMRNVNCKNSSRDCKARSGCVAPQETPYIFAVNDGRLSFVCGR